MAMRLFLRSDSPNNRRLQRLCLESTCFEEERILHYIFQVISHGGMITLDPNDESYTPTVACFPGVPRKEG